MRPAMAMIELIFAIVIIAISVMTIPSMMNVASTMSKGIVIDEDVMARLNSQMIDKFQARWGGEYVVDGNTSIDTNISNLSGMSDLNCSRVFGGSHYRINPSSNAKCNLSQVPRAIPPTVGNGINQADGNVSKGVEKLNGGTETLSITSSTGETFNINATYNVRYVPSTLVSMNGNTATARWRLGSSGTITTDNNGSLGALQANRTHLKRVVVNFWNSDLDVNTTLTFYKSNIGVNR